jgi:hypothetical protein
MRHQTHHHHHRSIFLIITRIRQAPHALSPAASSIAAARWQEEPVPQAALVVSRAN